MDRLFFKYLAPLLAISITPILAIVLVLFFFIRNNISDLEKNLIYQNTESLKKEISNKNEAIAKTEGMFIEQEIDKIWEKLKAMGYSPDFINLDVDNINVYADNFFSKEPAIVEINIVNKWGDIIYQKLSSMSLEAESPVDITDSDIFKVLEKRKPYLSEVEVSTSTQLPFITLGQPILDYGGNFIAGIIVKLDLEFVRDMVSEESLNGNGFFYIVSSKGHLISHPSKKEFLQNPDYSKYDYIVDILKKRNGTIVNEGNLVSFYTNKFGWTTIIEIPLEEALAPVDENQQTILSFINATLKSISYFTVLIILFGFLIATIAAVFITKRVITPIVNFTEATRRISQGELSLKVEKLSNDEIGELTDSFNKMTEELRKEREELLKSNEFIKKQAQEILKKKESQQDFNIYADDLEKPLTRVKSYLAGLEEKNESKEGVTRVIEDVEQIDVFLKDLFDHSNISAKVHDYEPVNFLEAFKTVAESLKTEIKKSNASIKCNNLPTTKALRSSVIQLFQNLISNAIKYSGDHPPEIFVSSEDKGDEWLFKIRDNGKGIEASSLEDIFKVSEHKVNGHFEYSFGLAICKHIVERHGGRIWAESEPGKGTTFYFTIKKY